MQSTGWLRKGKVSVTVGGTVVSGTSVGMWGRFVVSGDLMLLDGRPYQIVSVSDVDNLHSTAVITPAYVGVSDLVDADYAILRTHSSVTPISLANSLTDTIQDYHHTMDQMMFWMTGGGDGSQDSMTMQDFAGLSGLTVPTLPFLAPQQMLAAVVPAPYKIPKADASGKLDPNWLPAELVAAILAASNPTAATGATSITSAESLVQQVWDPTKADVVVNTKAGRHHDVFLKGGTAAAPGIVLNWINDGTKTPTHTGVALNAAMTLTVRIMAVDAGGYTPVWSGMPIHWLAGSAPDMSFTAADELKVFQFRWLSSTGIAGLPSNLALNCWVGWQVAGNSGSDAPAAAITGGDLYADAGRLATSYHPPYLMVDYANQSEGTTPDPHSDPCRVTLGRANLTHYSLGTQHILDNYDGDGQPNFNEYQMTLVLGQGPVVSALCDYIRNTITASLNADSEFLINASPVPDSSFLPDGGWNTGALSRNPLPLRVKTALDWPGAMSLPLTYAFDSGNLNVEWQSQFPIYRADGACKPLPVLNAYIKLEFHSTYSSLGVPTTSATLTLEKLELYRVPGAVIDTSMQDPAGFPGTLTNNTVAATYSNFAQITSPDRTSQWQGTNLQLRLGDFVIHLPMFTFRSDTYQPDRCIWLGNADTVSGTNVYRQFDPVVGGGWHDYFLPA